MADITNVQLGVCSVTFNSVDLGHTKGGVEYTYEPEYYEVTVDKYGNTPVEKKLVGEKIMVKVPLAEFTIDNLKAAIPNATYAGAANRRITIGKSAGQSMRSLAAQLVLHPITEGTRRHDIVLHKAVVDSAITIGMNNEGEKIIEVTFAALLDESKNDGNYLGLIGDSTA